MIIDDEPGIVQAIELALKINEYRAGRFMDPKKAIEEFRNNSQEYNLNISDMRMPAMSWFEPARNNKEVDLDVLLVFMTASEINKSEFSSLFPSMQVSELVTKPFVNALLIRIVRKYAGITEQH